ncbi:hypothetical protein BJ165DRAFT_649137 [Panaeolus papilionaceus]|nr:hypothetical protein BJ165DRAFT_649137 [Panaeolus papilionaceus]
MMLTELPAIPALPAMDRSALVDRFPVFSLSRFTPSFPLLLTLLASLVIIASLRAAVLFLRPLSKNAKAQVSVIPALVSVQGQEKLENASAITPSSSLPSSASASASSSSSKSIIVPSKSASIPAPPPSPGSSEAQKPQTRRRWSSWGWGLVKWDTLPALPPYNGTVGGGSGNGNASTSRWEQQQLQRQQQQPMMMQHRRQFESPPPALYQSEVPVSMAKMIMSRHVSVYVSFSFFGFLSLDSFHLALFHFILLSFFFLWSLRWDDWILLYCIVLGCDGVRLRIAIALGLRGYGGLIDGDNAPSIYQRHQIHGPGWPLIRLSTSLPYCFRSLHLNVLYFDFFHRFHKGRDEGGGGMCLRE